jgi:hypothetical protein
MTDLYKDAIAEAKKLREVAVDEAKSKIIEAIAPYVQNMITQETNKLSGLLFEEEDMSGMQNVPNNSANEAPVATVDAGPVSLPLPDEDGKIVLDFDQLFSASADGDTVEPVGLDQVAPAQAMPPEPSEPAPIGAAEDMVSEPTDSASDAVASTPTSPEDENAPTLTESVMSYDKFVQTMSEINFKIDYALHRGNRINDIVQESMKNKLFSLLENLDKLHETGKVSPKMAKINEKRLEFLFLKLKEAGLNNSYNQAKDKENAMSKSLKEFAASLFESEDQESLAMDSASTGKTGVPVDHEMTDHAMDQSGISSEVDDLFAEGLEASETVSTAGAGTAGSVDADELLGLDIEEMPHEEGEPLAEEVEAEGHAGFGDTDEDPVAAPEMFFEVDEEELKEAVRAIRKENFIKKARAIKEAKLKKEMKDKGWEEGKPPKDDASKAVLKKEVKKTMPKTKKRTVREDVELVLGLDLPDEVEDLLDPEDMEVDVEVRHEDEEEHDLEMSDDDDDLEMSGDDDDSLLLVDDEDEAEDMDSEDEMSMGDEGVSDEEAKALMESTRRAHKANRRLFETAKAAKREVATFKQLAESRKKNLIGLKKELAETNLFLSKLLYLNKFLQMEGLSRKQKQHIVEHLDKAKTIAEAKEVYGKIKNKLNEATTSGKPTGSSSKAVGTGSARLTESVNGTNGSGVDPVVGTFDRWQTLAQIKKDNK